MKSKMILTSIFAIMIVAGMSYGQHVKVFDGTRGVLLSAAPDSADTPVFAGRTIRLRIASPNNIGLALFKGAFPVSSHVPCEGGGPPTPAGVGGMSGGKVSWGYNWATSEYNYVWKTDKAWKGTCRMVVVKLRDGTEHRSRIQFR